MDKTEGRPVLLCANPGKDPGLSRLREVRGILDEMGIGYEICSDPVQLRERSVGAGMAVTFGGDGAILRAARALAGRGVPILGINLGHKGFMAELEASETPLVRRAFEGRYTIEERMMADVTVLRGGEAVYRDFALNEAVLGGVARVIGVAVYGDGRRITDFTGDGVIACTPTGSTAYSLSAGGPIVEPAARSIIVTPVCPHMLSARSYVLSPDRTVTMELTRSKGGGAYLSVDGGEVVKLELSDRVEVRRSPLVTGLVRFTGVSFYEKVNSKLGDMRRNSGDD